MNWFGDRTQIIIVFIAASFIILYFTPNKILATDESQVLIYLVDSEPFGIPYTNGQNHGGTGYLEPIPKILTSYVFLFDQ